jgi:chromosome segregation ATPase
MMKKQVVTTVHAKQNESDMESIDPGILAFGTSVSINDDLRRCIGVEIQEIDSICAKLKEDTSRESNICDDLVKTKSHAINEVQTLDQGASDIVDNLNMNVQILAGLDKTVNTALAPDTNNIKEGQEENPSRHESGVYFGSLQSIRDGQKERRDEMNELRTWFDSKGKQVKKLRHDVKSIRESRNAVDLMNGELEKTLAASDHLIDNAKRELECENLKVLRTEEKLQGVIGRIEEKRMSIKLQVNYFMIVSNIVFNIVLKP